MGSKARFVNEILPIITKDRKDNQWFVDLFCGGCSIAQEVDGKVIANDKNKYLIAMFKGLQENRNRPTEITKDLYNVARDVYNGKEKAFNHTMEMVDIWWNGVGVINSGEKKIHPTQKPVKLYKWLLKNYAQEGFKIVDTHLGSGSHAIAVEEMNRFEKMNLTLTACEIDKEYFTDTTTRIINHVAQQSLF